MYDKNNSPVGWYIGTYLIRFIEIEEQNNYNPEQKFLSWENTVIVKANNIDEAYKKIETIGKSEQNPYKGGPGGISVQWVYEGITELLPIYEELEDGAELMWRENKPKKLKNIKSFIKDIKDFKELI